jgi:outer membrane protein assembly factor BamD (BamD/ComL family)
MKRILFILSAALVISSCQNEPTEEIIAEDFDSVQFIVDLQRLDSIMANGLPAKKDIKKALVMYQDFANYFPNDPKAPNYLFQVSDFYYSLEQHEKAVSTLTTIIEKYPDYNRIEAVYFTRANHTDMDLRDTTLAKQYYEEFLEKYPNSQYANDAKVRMENVGLSIEDMVKKFDEMNAAASK